MNKITEGITNNREMAICIQQKESIITIELEVSELSKQERIDLVKNIYSSIKQQF